MPSDLIQVVRGFRLADAFDIAIVATFIYWGILWLRRTGSRSVLLGVVLAALLYLLARALELYLTTLLFNAVLAVLAVALVVVFQQDLRRAFERLSTLGRVRRRTPASARAEDVNMLCQTAFELAGNKTGALIVIAGRESVAAHLEGGVELNGQLSGPLLISIFDPHSVGHDGAVIIEHGLITRFAAHLPLSVQHDQLGDLGTRHTAALGLAERCDALVIVVSEERGSVRVALQGNLEKVATAEELAFRVNEFLEGAFPTVRPTIHRMVTRRFRTKVAAVALALLAWVMLVHHSETIYRTFVVPIEYRNVPANVDVARDLPREAQITLAGSAGAFQFLPPETLRVSLDLAEVAHGRFEFPLTDKNLPPPPGLSIFRIEPSVVYVPTDD